MSLDNFVEGALDSLKAGLLTSQSTDSIKYLDRMMGRLLDISVDSHLNVASYVVWLSHYRINHMHDLHDEHPVFHAQRDPYEPPRTIIVHRDDEEMLPNNYFGE